jgi:beta-galactosidase
MEKRINLTRRKALQGMASVAAAAMMTKAGSAQKTAAWPSEIPSNPERMQAFNSDWRFHRGDAPGAEATAFDDSTWRVLDVPHDWSIEDLPEPSDPDSGAIWVEGSEPIRTGPFDMYATEGQTATGWTVGGIGWYRKSFNRPPLPNGKAELRFEGVYMNCDVWLNGEHLENHPYGYTEFAFDLTPRLIDGRNTVVVRVNNSGRNSRWYSGSGIFRKVWLSVAGELRIPAHGVFVATPEVSKDAATVKVEITVESAETTTKRANVRVRVVDMNGAIASVIQSPVSIRGGRGTAVCTLQLKNPRLWSPSDSQLYRAEVLLEQDRKVVDSTAVELGIRKVEIDTTGLRINGERIKLRGGCVHHDNGPLGSACIPRAEERRIEILKANGFNAIRTSHNPPSTDFLNACDRVGMLVIDEAFDCWEAGNKNPEDYHLYFKDWWQRDLESMILRDRNHPCVILWSIGNEINERAEPRGIEIGKALAAHAHTLDPTRKVTAAICHPWDHPKQTWNDMQPAFTYLDVAGYNYQWEEYKSDHAKYPERIMVGTESFPNQAFQNWSAVENNSWVLGDFVWTAIDYLGESGIAHSSISNGQGPDSFVEPYPWFNSYCGDIDLIGNKKPQSYFRDVVWRRSKVEMAVQRPVPEGWTERISRWGWSDELRSWTWPGFEGKPLKVRVYTRGDRVKLLLNGTEVGSKDLADKDALQAEFSLAYAPGELKAVAYENGQEIGSISFSTVGKPHKLVLSADRTKMRPNRDDLSFVSVQVVDEQGQVVPDAIVPISFSVSGVGEIAAVGNANPKNIASFRQPKRETFHGTCMIVVRPAGRAGVIEVRGEAAGLHGAALQLQVAG